MVTSLSFNDCKNHYSSRAQCIITSGRKDLDGLNRIKKGEKTNVLIEHLTDLFFLKSLFSIFFNRQFDCYLTVDNIIITCWQKCICKLFSPPTTKYTYIPTYTIQIQYFWIEKKYNFKYVQLCLICCFLIYNISRRSCGHCLL